MIIVDVETTGTHPDRHAIISIGAVDFTSPQRQFYRECRIWQGAHVQDEALAVNGATIQEITDPTRLAPEDALGQFIAWCKETDDRTLAGHNTSFDRDFLQAAADRHNLAWHFGHRVIDLHSCGWMHMVQSGTKVPMRGGRSGLSCDAVLVYTGLPEEPKPHNGLMGAKMEAEAFSRLLHKKNLLEEFQQYPLSPVITGIALDNASNPQSSLL